MSAPSPGFKRYLEATGQSMSVDRYLAKSLLDFLKQKWARLERRKAGKLKKFLAQNTCAKWPLKTNKPKPDRLGNVCLWDLEDKDIETVFENSPAGVLVEIADVTKARKWVAKNVLDGQKFAAKVLDPNGFLDLKHRLRPGRGGNISR